MQSGHVDDQTVRMLEQLAACNVEGWVNPAVLRPTPELMLQVGQGPALPFGGAAGLQRVLVIRLGAGRSGRSTRARSTPALRCIPAAAGQDGGGAAGAALDAGRRGGPAAARPGRGAHQPGV